MKVFKWLFVSVVGLGALVVGAYYAFSLVVSWSSQGVGSDGGAGSAFLRSQFHDGPRYYELTANLEVEGKSVEITRVIECLPYFAHRLQDYFQKRWYTNQEAMTHRLPNGSGIIIVVPKLCEEFADPQPIDAPSWKSFPDLPEDFVPLILWTANANDPAVLEGYHSFESLTRPDSRVQFKNIALRNDPGLEPRDYPEEFGVWANAKFGGLFGRERPVKREFYAGYYLISVNQDEWAQVPELKLALSSVDASGFLEPDLRVMVARSFLMHTNFAQQALNGDMISRQLGTQDSRERTQFRLLDEAYGLDLIEGVLVPSKKKRGVIKYYREDVGVKKELHGASVIRFSLKGTIFDWPADSRINDAYFESASQAVFEVERAFIEFRRMNGRT